MVCVLGYVVNSPFRDMVNMFSERHQSRQRRHVLDVSHDPLVTLPLRSITVILPVNPYDWES